MTSDLLGRRLKSIFYFDCFTFKGCFTLCGMCIVYAQVHEVQGLIGCRCVSIHAAARVCYTQASVPFVCRYVCLLHVCMPTECGCRYLLNAGVSMHSFTEAREQHQVSPPVSLLPIVWDRSLTEPGSLFQLDWLANKCLGSTYLHPMGELIFYQFNAS